MHISVRFIGGLFRVSGRNKLILNLKYGTDLRWAVERITQEFPELKATLIDLELQDPRPTTLIFLNGKEISILQGMETKLGNGDEIAFIPISHGG